MCVNVRRKPYKPIQDVIKGQIFEQVQCYKYMGTVIDNKADTQWQHSGNL